MLSHEHAPRPTRAARAHRHRAGCVRLGPDDFDAPPTPVAHHRAPRAVRAAQPARSGARSPSASRRVKVHGAGRARTRRPTVAELEAAVDGAPGRAAIRSATRGSAPRRRSSGSSATLRALERRVAGPEREPGPPVRPCARRARGVGLRRRLGAHRRRASCSPGSTPRPTCSSPRRSAKASSTGSSAPELAAVVSCFTYERRGPDGDAADAAGALADDDGRAAGRGRSSGSGATLDAERGRRRAARDPRARPRLHAATRTSGRGATTSPTCSTTTS